jgi:hypothetical protein
VRLYINPPVERLRKILTKLEPKGITMHTKDAALLEQNHYIGEIIILEEWALV